MDRPRASIIILAWNEWERTRACLDSLRPTLRPTDEVIVVDNGSEDHTPRGLRTYGWLQVITNAENRGFAAGCNQGAAAASGDVLVFLNNDTVLVPQWLDRLVAPFSDDAVGATGPRSNFVSGPQLVEDAGYDGARRREIAAFARRWATEHDGQVSDADRLVGFCLAVRRTAFEAVGGFHEGYGIGGFEDDDLSASLRKAGHRLLIVHDSFVHHVGHATFAANGIDWHELQTRNQEVFLARHGRRPANGPSLSACLIVKDEAELLPACLESLVGVVDEVVVYDTGSTDGTPELARRAGALVVEGHWDADFGRARNAALAACQGEWILHIDADERLVGDGASLRRSLAATRGDALAVQLDNEGDNGEVSLVHTAPRLFKRARAHWEGRLHERLVARPGQGPLRTDATDAVRLRHLGYRSELIARGDKAARNLAIAEAELAAGEGSRSVLLLNLARSLATDKRYDEALARVAEALDAASGPGERIAARTYEVDVLQYLGRVDEALGAIDRLAEDGESEEVCTALRDRAAVVRGDADAAARVLQAGDTAGAAGWSVSSERLRSRAAVALADDAAARGDWPEAARILLELLAATPSLPHWRQLVDAAARADVVDPAAAAVPQDLLRSVLAQVATGDPIAADRFGEALLGRFPGDHRVLAFAAHVAPHLSVERAMSWAVRLRQAGLDRCPLASIAADLTRSPDDRLQAIAAAHAAFGGVSTDVHLPAVSAAVAEGSFVTALVILDELAADLLPAFVQAAATSPARAAALADALEELGAAEQATSLRDFAEVLNHAG